MTRARKAQEFMDRNLSSLWLNLDASRSMPGPPPQEATSRWRDHSLGYSCWQLKKSTFLCLECSLQTGPKHEILPKSEITQLLWEQPKYHLDFFTSATILEWTLPGSPRCACWRVIQMYLGFWTRISIRVIVNNHFPWIDRQSGHPSSPTGWHLLSEFSTPLGERTSLTPYRDGKQAINPKLTWLWCSDAGVDPRTWSVHSMLLVCRAATVLNVPAGADCPNTPEWEQHWGQGLLWIHLVTRPGERAGFGRPFMW